MPGRPLLPLEIGLLLLSITSHLVDSAFGQITQRLQNENASCAGTLAPLNAKNGDSPCAIYNSLQTPCSSSNPIGYPATACTCNNVAYNLASACTLCGNNPVSSWSSWAQDNDCEGNIIPSKPMYPLPSEGNIPKWASKTLASPDATFDVTAAIQSTKPGWTPIQIALPVITAVAVLLLAALAFWCWRRSKQPHTKSNRVRYWQDAHLQGPRRFFGLFPDILQVRKQTVDTLWEIDDSARARDEVFSPPRDISPTHICDRPPEDVLSHSRMSSSSSLLPTTSRPPSSSHSYHSTSAFSNFLSRLTWSSPTNTAKARYKTGVAKAPEYKRVNVMPDKTNGRFKIDNEEGGAEESGLARGPLLISRMLSPGGKRVSSGNRASTLPSVLDISMGNTGDASSDRATTSGENGTANRGRFGVRPAQSTLYGTAEEDESAQFMRPPRSDFTLGTTDLITPISGGFTDNEPGSRRPLSPTLSARADSEVLPPSPAAVQFSSPIRPSRSAPHLPDSPLGKPHRG